LFYSRCGQLAPFFILSLLLHAVLLFSIRQVPANISSMPTLPMEVRLDPPPEVAQARRGSKTPAVKKLLPQQTQAFHFDSRDLRESAKTMAGTEARAIEQHVAAEEQKRLNTPIGLLEQYLKQPHKEERLANGTLKILTVGGFEVCYQLVPYFGNDHPGLYGIPMSCP
jgi:hypothetical protein